jgi:hypothetical protein
MHCRCCSKVPASVGKLPASVNKRKPVLRIGRQVYGNDPGPGNI